MPWVGLPLPGQSCIGVPWVGPPWIRLPWIGLPCIGLHWTGLPLIGSLCWPTDTNRIKISDYPSLDVIRLCGQGRPRGREGFLVTGRFLLGSWPTQKPLQVLAGPQKQIASRFETTKISM